MKRRFIFLISLTTFFMGCTSENSESNDSQTEINLNPPDWILGTFMDESVEGYGWRFVENNALHLINNEINLDLKFESEREINNWEGLKRDDVIQELSDNNRYEITRIWNRGESRFIYRFKKESDDVVLWLNGPGFEIFKLVKQ